MAASVEGQFKQFRFLVPGITCAGCVNTIKNKISALPNVFEVEVFLTDKTVLISGNDDLKAQQLLDAFQAIGYQGHYVANEFDDQQRVQLQEQQYRQKFRKTSYAWLVGVPVSLIEMLNIPHFLAPSLYWLSISSIAFLSLSVIVYSGGHFFKNAWKSMVQLNGSMDLLVSCGVGIAWLYSAITLFYSMYLSQMTQHYYFESALLILAFVNLGQLLEFKASKTTDFAIQRLLDYQPKTAKVILNDEETILPIEKITKDMLIRVAPGEKIPLDGVVVSGVSSVDQSLITGESIPIQKKMGDKVIGGTVNKLGSLIFKVTHLTQDSVLFQISQLVKKAQQSKPKLAHLADRVSQYFVPAILCIAFFTGFFWHFYGHQSLFFVLNSICSVLLIACPCALGLAIPMSVTLGIGRAAQQGILIKNAHAIQAAAKVDHVIFDKTGTLTKGLPEVIGLEGLNIIAKKQLLEIAASLEALSEHPLGLAIKVFAQQEKIMMKPIEQFEVVPGRGIKGLFEGLNVSLGNYFFMKEQGLKNEKMKKQSEKFAEKGQTPVFVSLEKKILGFIVLADPIKAETKKVITQLKNLGLQLVMMTGDHPLVAEATSRELGIKNIFADLLPEQKLSLLEKLQREGHVVAFVGDGINDAPALSQADVGIAVQQGTDVAIESADISLLNHSLLGVIDSILLSRGIVRNMKQNLFGAFIYNVLGVPIAAGVLYPFLGLMLSPMLASLMMAFSSVTVVLNANRLRYYRNG